VAVRRVVSDEERRAELVRLGRARVQSLSWPRAAATFRALYRRVAGRPLSPEDEALLDAPPVM
jgi:hypothetical protein